MNRAIAFSIIAVLVLSVFASGQEGRRPSPPQPSQGYNCVFMGHSFFNLVKGLPTLAKKAGLTRHRQQFVFLGGPMGTPGWFWDVDETRSELQRLLKKGDVDLLGMTYCSSIPGARHEPKVAVADYRRWVDFALRQNPNTRFYIGTPWPTFPDEPDEVYASNYEKWLVRFMRSSMRCVNRFRTQSSFAFPMVKERWNCASGFEPVNFRRSNYSSRPIIAPVQDPG
ncbi:MAG: hypothetical protein AAGD07_22645 [Planctomycetota bacterium]